MNKRYKKSTTATVSQRNISQVREMVVSAQNLNNSLDNIKKLRPQTAVRAAVRNI